MSASSDTNKLARMELADIDRKIADLNERRQHLAALLGKPAPTNGGGFTRATPKTRVPISERVPLLVDYLRQHPSVEFTITDVAVALEWPESSTYKIAAEAVKEGKAAAVRTTPQDNPAVIKYRPTNVKPGEPVKG